MDAKCRCSECLTSHKARIVRHPAKSTDVPTRKSEMPRDENTVMIETPHIFASENPPRRKKENTYKNENRKQDREGVTIDVGEEVRGVDIRMVGD